MTEPVDNVWIMRDHKWKIYPFEEAVQAHRELHDPTIHNSPNAFIKAFIELDMQVGRNICIRMVCYAYTYKIVYL